MEKQYFIKLFRSVYRVTALLQESEPLKFKIRELADKILADLIFLENSKINFQKKKGRGPTSADSLCLHILSKIEILNIYFDLAREQEIADAKNFLILKQSYDKIIDQIKQSCKDIEPDIKYSQLKKNPVSFPNLDLDVSKRQKEILKILKERKQIQVGELKKFFPSLSKRTLRRDLENLLKQSLVQRAGQWNKVYYKLV